MNVGAPPPIPDHRQPPGAADCRAWPAASVPLDTLEWMRDQLAAAPERAALDGFVRFWFREPRGSGASGEAYDFFLLKIVRFVEFVREALPAASGTVEREAQALREGYRAANEMVGTEN